MELREWLIILGLVLVAIIVVDGVRRLQRQRRVPRLDLDSESRTARDPDDAKREEQLNWELPNGGARVVSTASTTGGARSTADAERDEDADYDDEFDDDAIEEEAPPGRFAGLSPGKILRRPLDEVNKVRAARQAASERRDAERKAEAERQAQARQDEERRELARAERERLAARPRREPDDFESAGFEGDERYADAEPFESHEAPRDDVVAQHPAVERAKRHHVSAERARDTLAEADEIIVISVMSRDEEGFSGPALLQLMLACGLRYSEAGIFHRFESESDDSALQFSMVNVLKPGTFDLDAMDEDFTTPGVTFLMPLPGADDTHAAFEAMFETAMVLVRNLGGELKDENRSVMTAQTVEFARQRVHDFERRWRLHRHHAN